MLALERYDWNARVAAAFHHDLGHLEVGLRNAHDRALSVHDHPGDLHWVHVPERHFPARSRTGGPGRTYDPNRTTRAKSEEAVSRAAAATGGGHPASGKVVAELNLGFWRYLTVNRHDQLWRTHLHRAFRPGTRRAVVRDLVDGLHQLRNRVAHHESLLGQPLDSRHHDLSEVAGLISVPLRDHIAAVSSVPAVLTARL